MTNEKMELKEKIEELEKEIEGWKNLCRERGENANDLMKRLMETERELKQAQANNEIYIRLVEKLVNAIANFTRKEEI